MSPHFCYRVDLRRRRATGVQPLSDYELASRLSYFLWSSMPDEELLARAAAGDLHQPEVLAAQARRMLRDDRVRGLATEFGGNWLDFRRFEEHNSVDRERFPAFDDELRQAMFEEPIRFFVDVVRHDRSVLDFLVRRAHVRQPGPGPALRHARRPSGGRTSGCGSTTRPQYGRGGLLPMAVFLTKNAPGLRTSPVKRGYWVVRRLLGEHIPAPPADVPELPDDEAKLGELTLREALARHRERQELRRLPRAVRLDRPGVRGLRPGRRAPRQGPRRPAGRHPRDVPRRRRGDRPRRPARLPPRAPRRTSSSTTSAASCWPTPSGRSLLPVGRRDRSTRCEPKLAADGYRFGSLVESDRHQPAVPEQARRTASTRSDAMMSASDRDRTQMAVARRPGGRSSAASGVAMALPWLESVPVWGAEPAGGEPPRRARSGSPPCSWAAASTPTTGGPRAPAPRWSWARASSRWRRCKAKLNVINGLFNKNATGVGIHPGPDRQHPLRRGAAEGGGAEGRHQHRPGAGQPPRARRPSSRAWSWAASSRSPATTRRTSRWPTARTSPGRTRPRRCRWRSIRRWRSTASSTTAAAGGTRASSTACRSEAAGLSRQVSAGDRAKLDEYLTSVREVEKRRRADAGRRRTRPTSRAEGPAASPLVTMPRPDNGLPEDIREHMRLMCDIVALAFQTDKTRVATLLLCRDISGLFYPFLDVRDGPPLRLARRPVRRLRAGHAVLRQPARLPRRPPRRDARGRGHGARQLLPAVPVEHVVGQPSTTASKLPVAAGRRPGRHARDRPRARLRATRATTTASSAACTCRSWTAWASSSTASATPTTRLAGL